MSALEGESQPSGAGVEPAGCFKQGQGVISNQGGGDFKLLAASKLGCFKQGQVISSQGRNFKLLATKMTTELF